MTRHQFKRLYSQYMPKIYRFIYLRVGGDKELAEDLTSEVFLKAMEKMEELDTTRHPGAWLYLVARNRLKNHYRDQKQHVDVDDVAWYLQGEDGRQVFEQLGDAQQLMQLLGTLSQEDRQILSMKHLEGWSYKEIATVVKKSAGAVRVQAHRALQQLKQAQV